MERSDQTTCKVPDDIQKPFRSALEAAAEVWCAEWGSRLLSIVLFGSVARRRARPDSDVDLVLVAQGFPRSLRDRRRPFLAAWDRARVQRGLPAIEWNLVTKSPEEAKVHSPLYLDLVEDAVFLLDREDLVRRVLSDMRERMRRLGSRRVYLDEDTWYWDLKPDFRFGDVVEI